MTRPSPAAMPVTRLAPLALVAVGLGLIGLLVDGLLHRAATGEPWWLSVAGLVPAGLLAGSGASRGQAVHLFDAARIRVEIVGYKRRKVAVSCVFKQQLLS